MRDDLIDPGDFNAMRQRLFDRAATALRETYAANSPKLIGNDRYILQLSDVGYTGKDRISLAEQKKAILEDRTVSRPLKGAWQLVDKATGKVVSKGKRRTIMNVPYLTDRGTFIRNGTEYTVANQFRLVPNMYFRKTDDGMPEAHINAKPRTGPSFRMYMDPDTAVFYMRHRGNKIPLYPVLRAMGVDDSKIQKSWGDDIYKRNQKFVNAPHAINWINKIVSDPRYNPDLEHSPTDVFEDEYDMDVEVRSALFGDNDDPMSKEAQDFVESTLQEIYDELAANPPPPPTVDESIVAGPFERWEPRPMVELPSQAMVTVPALQTPEDKLLYALGAQQRQELVDAAEQAEAKQRQAVEGLVQSIDVLSDAAAPIGKIGAEGSQHEKQASGALNKIYNDATRTALTNHFGAVELDPVATSRTMGKPVRYLEPDHMLEATGRLLSINRGEDSGDSRDALQFQQVYDVTDFLDEKIRQDQNRVVRQALWRISKDGDADKMPVSLMDKHLDQLFNNDRLSQAIEEISLLEPYDQAYRVTRLGSGGIPSLDSVPKDARNVQPSQMGFVDSVRSPESLKVGVDLRLASGIRKGKDNLLYREMIDAKTGEKRWVSMREAADLVMAMPYHMKSKAKFIPAMVKGQGVEYIDRSKVDVILPDADMMFSTGANLVPIKSSIKPMRLLMGGKHGMSAVPLVNREQPYVQTRDPNDPSRSVEQSLARSLGAVKAEQGGVVKAVYADHIDVVTPTGEVVRHEVHNSFPLARKTFVHTKPQVKAGDKVEPGQILASSNFTDSDGTAALGTHLRVGYMNYRGYNFEDGVVISEGAAKKLTSQHMYSSTTPKDKSTTFGKKQFIAQFPSKYDKRQLDQMDDDGIVKPGTVLKKGDPMVLAYKETEPGQQTMGRRLRSNKSDTWEHEYPAVVTDIARSKQGYVVYTRANVPMQEGDKLGNRMAAKGVVAKVVPDSEMPRDSQGRPLELLYSPMGIQSRTNSAQLVETLLGKVAEKTGKRYVLPGFFEDDDPDDPDATDRWLDFAKKELDSARMSDREKLFNPVSGKEIDGILTGNTYIYKHQHMSESKGKGRATAAYSMDEVPLKGGSSGAKHLGTMELQALLGHGATDVLRDAKLIKGQRNDAFWRALKLGQTPAMPGVPYTYEKFSNLLQAAGIKLTTDKDGDHIFAMTDRQAQDLTGDRQIRNSKTYTDKDLRPIEGGLFDPKATGSELDGKRWSYIPLPEPMLNPVMEDPIRSILGIKKKELQGIIDGKVEVGGERGGKALHRLLEKLDMQAAKDNALAEAKGNSKAKRDAAIKRLNFLTAMEKQGVKPVDFMMSRVPVLPPRFRPITKMDKMTMVADPNLLYKEVMEASEDYQTAVNEGLPMPVVNEARANLYQSYKALVGVGDPVKAENQDKGVGGILKTLLGKGSPKNSFVQRRVIGTNMDVGGLAVIAPNPSLKINQVGLPEKQAWNIYEPFIIRDLVKRGVSALDAAKMAKQHHGMARDALERVVKQRPVLINRAPTLHKYSVMAAYPVLTKGSTLQIHPAVVKPFNADFDGDTMSISVPVSQKAVEQAIKKMLPSRNLISDRNDKLQIGLANEYVQGLHLASRLTSKEQPRTFRTKDEAMRAYRKGEIKADTPIRIVG